MLLCYERVMVVSTNRTQRETQTPERPNRGGLGLGKNLHDSSLLLPHLIQEIQKSFSVNRICHEARDCTEPPRFRLGSRRQQEDMAILELGPRAAARSCAPDLFVGR